MCSNVTPLDFYSTHDKIVVGDSATIRKWILITVIATLSFLMVGIILLCCLAKRFVMLRGTCSKQRGISCRDSVVRLQRMCRELWVSKLMLSSMGLPVQGNAQAYGCSYSGETPCGTKLLQKERVFSGSVYPVSRTVFAKLPVHSTPPWSSV